MLNLYAQELNKEHKEALVLFYWALVHKQHMTIWFSSTYEFSLKEHLLKVRQ